MARQYFKHSDETDAILIEVFSQRGTNTLKSTAKKAIQEVFRRTNAKMTASSATNRYHLIRANNAEQEVPRPTDVCKTIIDTMDIQKATFVINGAEITVLFK